VLCLIDRAFPSQGRLGNLGKIDDKYDVAISTAAPGLDNLVVDSVEIGQQCLEHIRRNDLGRANIICLSALPTRDYNKIQTPGDAPRLFDLVQMKDEKFAGAFYMVLRDTLVANDLEQANKLAFGGGKRWRVVTLDGKLIDTSGTMSGGGNRVVKGAMSSKFAAEEVSPAVVEKLEQETKEIGERLEKAKSDKLGLEKKVKELGKRNEQIEERMAKLNLEMQGAGERIEEAKKRVKELQ
jgi:structural maintenance of chromosome 4